MLIAERADDAFSTQGSSALRRRAAPTAERITRDALRLLDARVAVLDIEVAADRAIAVARA
jgi:hypothetical protein